MYKLPISFHEFRNDDVFACITGLINNVGRLDEEELGQSSVWYCDSVAKMAAYAEGAKLRGNIWQLWLARLFAECETPFAIAQERRPKLSGTLNKIAAEDMELLFYYFNFDLRKLDAIFDMNVFGRLRSYKPLTSQDVLLQSIYTITIQRLADAMKSASYAKEMYDALLKFHSSCGAGQYALHKAFRWDGRSSAIVPVTSTEDIMLNGLIGYEEQKKILIDNTTAFIEGRPANNVLLYGEGGTGKSSSVKALLNEFAYRGLRMIEIYKHQIEDLDAIVDMIKDRNYRFILFMDDLSFEQFEVEYKYLKAFIEGGLEKRPDNILIYATSNRRHLMKETWGDRDDKSDDMHESETMQEKMSLVDRFGLLVRYYSPEQEEYLGIVRALAKEYNVKASDGELEHGAIRWELKHGGFSGRVARQFVEYLAGANGGKP